MLKQFWEERKHIIQITGILSAVGALFLAIPLPTDQAARNALLHIQLLWLLIVSVSAIIILREILIVSTLWEKNMSKTNPWFNETISLIISGGIIYFITYLWEYMIALYKNSFFDFFNIFVNSGTLFLLWAIAYSFWKKMTSWLKKNNPTALFPFSLIAIAIICSGFGAWEEFIFSRGTFTIFIWLEMSAIIYGVTLLVMAVMDIYKKIKAGDTMGGSISEIK
jgi:hypothetical protein